MTSPLTLSAAIRCADNKELDIRRPRASEGDRSSQMVSVEMALKANRCCFRTNTRFIGRGEPPKPTTRCARHERDSHFKRLLRPTIQNPSSFKMHPRHLCSILTLYPSISYNGYPKRAPSCVRFRAHRAATILTLRANVEFSEAWLER